MKKLTMSVAALSIASMSYGQCVLSSDDSLEVVRNNILEITISAEDMIEWIGEDVNNGRIYREYADMYIESLEEIIERAKLLAIKE